MKKPEIKHGLEAARALKETLTKTHGAYVRNVYLFGSVAKQESHAWSDRDIAIVCEPFERSKVKELRAFYSAYPELDVRASLVVLHPDELENPLLTLSKEVKKYGVEV